MPSFKSLAAASTATLSLALGGCAALPGGGNIPGASEPITQSEAQIGAEAHPQLLAEFGGAMAARRHNMSSRSARISPSSPVSAMRGKALR